MGMTIGHLHVRRSILIRALPVRVWKEFETTEAVGAWFGRGHQLHVFEPRWRSTVESCSAAFAARVIVSCP